MKTIIKKFLNEFVEPTQQAGVYPFSVTLPIVGETVIYSENQNELTVMIRKMVKPAFGEQIKVRKITHEEVLDFFTKKRENALQNLEDNVSVEN